MQLRTPKQLKTLQSILSRYTLNELVRATAIPRSTCALRRRHPETTTLPELLKLHDAGMLWLTIQ